MRASANRPTGLATDEVMDTATGSGTSRTGPATGEGTNRRPATGRRPAYPVVLLGLAGLTTALLTGCGIRSTTVPVDAGPAPSRGSCAAQTPPASPAPDTVVRQVYLVCISQISPVPRVVPLRDSRAGEYDMARELITQLQISPGANEARANFKTAVPGNTLFLLTPQPGDPKGTLRLSQPVDELPSFALAQIVCTLTADPQVAPEHAVVLGGPDSRGLRRYTCTSDLRTRSDAADSAGTPVPTR